MKFNLRDLSSINEGKDGKDYAYIGFPKGTLYEGYLVSIPFHLALPTMDSDGNVDFWEYELKLPSNFTYHLSKTAIEIGPNNLPEPVVTRFKLTAEELEEGYRKFTDSHIMGTRVSIGTKEQVDTFFDDIANNILLNPPESERELIDNLIYALNKTESLMFPQKNYSVNLSYLVDLQESLKTYNLRGINKSMSKIQAQISARSSYEMSYKFKDIDTSNLRFIKQEVKELTQAKAINDRHKIVHKSVKL